ncbi:hypothetical protein OOK31_38500 [Streptomyces sp. NBC_00249]|uniref:hypothetical protein n=1 Tax=Streptomyces sp. NBC_00249 TaxID=2975690 RepID=UPI00225A1E19|nr:hypothetical protein [Streptomyces sp. NBC_00249]MCX5199703.1 hypothetical protein [Streptomyces sp. NBC_00249]
MEPLTDVLPGPRSGGPVQLANGRVQHTDGYTIDAATLDMAASATPPNTERARASRMTQFVSWCQERGRLHDDPGTLADWAHWLAVQQHPAETIDVYTATVAERLANSGVLVPPSERDLIARIVQARSRDEAQDDDGHGDVLQAEECTREDLAAMLAVHHPETVEGIRNRLVLSLAWYMGARASEPASLRVRDMRVETVRLVDRETGELCELPALVVTLRLSKTSPHGRTAERIRILAQEDDTCPVAAWRAWSAVLDRNGVTSGPLLRRVKNGQLTTAGRPPADPSRAGGIGDRTIRNVIASSALAAGLTRPLLPEEREIMSAAAERAELSALVLTEEGRAAVRTRRRLARRALRRELRRYSGHSMRRGPVRHDQRAGVSRDVIERQYRYTPGSRALARYLDDLVAWSSNPTVPTRYRLADANRA